MAVMTFAPQLVQFHTRVETASGTLYQFVRNEYADGTTRTMMVRLAGRGEQLVHIDDMVRVLEDASPTIGKSMHVRYMDPWENEPRSIITTPVVRVESW